MGCEGIRDDLEAYFDGELPPGAREVVEGHLSECASCRSELDDLRRAWEALDAYAVPEVAPTEPAAVLRVARRRERAARWIRIGTGMGIAAAVLVGLFLWGPFRTDGDLLGGLSPSEEREIVTNWDVLNHLDLLESLEVLENMDLLEEIPPDLLNGSEKG